MKRILLAAVLALSLSGCSSLMSSAASGLADNVTVAMLNQVDPPTAGEAIPTFIALIDSMLVGSPDDPDLLMAGATMYATYGGGFINDEVRASRLTTRARKYALGAICGIYEQACGWPGMVYDDFVATLDGLGPEHAEYVYTYGFASLAFLRAHSADWDSLAELPQVEALFNRYLDISDDAVNSGVYTYMGILLTLRPPALGGEPDRAREFFEQAIEVSGGRDLSAKVEYAKGYAKLLYERDLHDRLLTEVIEADPNQDGYVLTNVMAQEEAHALLAAADEYF